MRTLSLIAAAFALVGCVAERPTFMHPVAALDATPRADVATIVFVRGSTPCDEGAPFLIADLSGHFVGESAPATKLSVTVEPGPHAFVTWQPYGELRSTMYPNVNQVGVVSGTFEAGRWYVVEVRIATSPYGVRRTCGAYPWLAMRLVDPARDHEVAETLADAAPREADRAAGQAELDRDPGELERHLAMGREKLAARAR